MISERIFNGQRSLRKGAAPRKISCRPDKGNAQHSDALWISSIFSEPLILVDHSLNSVVATKSRTVGGWPNSVCMHRCSHNSMQEGRDVAIG